MSSEEQVSVSELIWQSPDRMSGAPCFRGTRIRVNDMFDWIAVGGSLDGFLETFSHLPREAAVQILRMAESDLMRHLKAA